MPELIPESQAEAEFSETDVQTLLYTLADTIRLTEELAISTAPYLNSYLDTSKYETAIILGVKSIRETFHSFGVVPGMIDNRFGFFRAFNGFELSGEGGPAWKMDFYLNPFSPIPDMELRLTGTQLSDSIVSVFDRS